jgi:hypothetical protein
VRETSACNRSLAPNRGAFAAWVVAPLNHILSPNGSELDRGAGCARAFAEIEKRSRAPHITQTASAISTELASVMDHSNESRPKKRVVAMVLVPVSVSFQRALDCFVTSRAERFEEIFDEAPDCPS